MVDDDRKYYQDRARIEAERAMQAKVPQAAAAHQRLAQAYRAKLGTGTGNGG